MFKLLAGPCVIENEELVMQVAKEVKEITDELGIDYYFKASFDKANRTSIHSFRGPGLEEGLRILKKVKETYGLKIVTDIHEPYQAEAVAEVADIIQIPAFLCRQTNFIARVMACGKPVNMKKGQFLSPWEMKNVVEKARSYGNNQIMVCERGATFGYNNLVSDMRSLAIMQETNCPVVFDATHSVQLPGGQGCSSGGQRQFVPVLAKAAVAVGIAGIFMETHPNPDAALCDGPNSWPLSKMRELLVTLQQIDAVIKQE